MARCGCTALGCTCRVNEELPTDCIATHVTGSGSSDDPYLISADLLPDPNGCLVCGASGLAVEVDPDSCLACGPNGMTVDVDPNGCLVCGPNGLTVEVNPSLENQLVCVPGEGLFVPPVTGLGGGNEPFIIVAAADTDPARQATADYVCDGIADEVEINLACAQADVWGRKACVLLLGGEYNLADHIVTGQFHSFRGEGAERTFIYFDGNGDAPPYDNVLWYDEFAIIFRGNQAVISDFYLNQGDNSDTGYRGGIAMFGWFSTAERLWLEIDGDSDIQQRQNAAIKAENEGTLVRHCLIECYDGTAIDWSRDLPNNVVRDCFIGAATGVDINGTATGEMVLNNFFDGGGVAGSNPNAGHAIAETYHYRLNTGISVIGSGSDQPILISGNIIGGFGKGILLDSTEQIIVMGNVIDRADFGTDEQAILIQEGTYYCNVSNNVLRPGYGGRVFLVGIEVSADCGDNQIANNDFLGAGSGPFTTSIINASVTTRSETDVYSPDGTAFRIKVDNAGVLSTEVIT